MSIRFFFDRLFRRFETKLQPLNEITVNRSALLHNYDSFLKLRSHQEIWPVLKSNAYGHGIAPVVSALKSRRFSYYIADSYLEALEIWRTHRHPVLLIGSLHPANFSKIDFSHLAFTVQDPLTLQAISAQRRPAKIHLKINTGMNRQGLEPSQLSDFLSLLQKYPHLALEGVFSHLADADNPADAYTPLQLRLFKKCLKQINDFGFKPKYVHLAATYGASKITDPDFNAVRLGLGLYGFGPLANLRPALTFTSSITKIGRLSARDYVGYNLTYQSSGSSNYAVLPIGYHEGLDRRLSNCGHVKFQNSFLPIIGRVCMNLSIASLGDLSANLFDPVTVISPNPEDKNSLTNIAQICQTIPYDILVHLHGSIHRQLVG